MSNSKKARELVEAFSTGSSHVLAYVSDKEYIQHNLSFPDGKSAILGFFADKPTGIDITVHRVIEDGNLVLVHSTYGGVWNENQPQVAFDVFRFEDGLAVEHWDNLLEDRGENASGRTQTDGPVSVKDKDKTESNRAIVTRLMNDCFLANDYTNVAEIISPVTYLQHNPDGSDGLEGFGKFVEYLTEQNIEMVYGSCYHIIVEGDFALTMADGTYGGQQTAYYDLFRLEDGMVVEHWDIVAGIPDKSEWNNENGKF